MENELQFRGLRTFGLYTLTGNAGTGRYLVFHSPCFLDEIFGRPSTITGFRHGTISSLSVVTVRIHVVLVYHTHPSEDKRCVISLLQSSDEFFLSTSRYK